MRFSWYTNGDGHCASHFHSSDTHSDAERSTSVAPKHQFLSALQRSQIMTNIPETEASNLNTRSAGRREFRSFQGVKKFGTPMSTGQPVIRRLASKNGMEDELLVEDTAILPASKRHSPRPFTDIARRRSSGAGSHYFRPPLACAYLTRSEAGHLAWSALRQDGCKVLRRADSSCFPSRLSARSGPVCVIFGPSPAQRRTR
jgi:hypothetical protein